MTLSSRWHLFKSAAESSWLSTRSPGSIQTEVVNIHGHVRDSIRRPERRERGQVMDGGRAHLTEGPVRCQPRRVPAGGPKLPPTPRPVQGVNAALTPAAGTLPRVKVQSNQFPQAESGVKSSHTASAATHAEFL